MPESSIVVRPEQKESANYTASSRLQATGLTGAMAIFEEAASVVPLPKPPQPIVIADYGASTAHNSLLPICAAIAVLPKRTRRRPCDPRRAYRHSGQRLHGDVPDTRRGSGQLPEQGRGDIRLGGRAIVLRTVMPSSSVNLGWSSWSIQWLSQVPSPIPDHIQVAYSSDEDVRAKYAKQAAHDWHEFIAFRGRELRPRRPPGGDDDGRRRRRRVRLPPHARRLSRRPRRTTGCRPGHRRGDSPDVCPGRRAQEATSLLLSRRPGSFEQLEIDHLEVFDAEDRFWSQYQVDSDEKAFGAKWAAFRAGIGVPHRSRPHSRTEPRGDRVVQFFDRLEAGVAGRLAAAPEQMQIPLAHLVLIKRPRSR